MSDAPVTPIPAEQPHQEASPLTPEAVPQVQPGDTLANPAQPYAPTVVPDKTPKDSFVSNSGSFSGYPKMKYHPVHGGIEIDNPNEEASLQPKTDWFDTAAAADAARTWTEAAVVSAQNMRAKMDALDEAGHPIVRNSVTAHEAIRGGKAEPL